MAIRQTVDYSYRMKVQGLLVLTASIFSFATTMLLFFFASTGSGIASVTALVAFAAAASSFVLHLQGSRTPESPVAAAPPAGVDEPHFSDLMVELHAILDKTPENIREIIEYPLFNRILSVRTTGDLGSLILEAHRNLVKAEKIIALLSDKFLTDTQVLLPLAESIIKAVPPKTEEAAFNLMEKFLVVREASGRAAASANILRTDLEDSTSEKSIIFTAENSRQAVHAERASIRELSACTRENSEQLQAMGKEIEAGLDLLKNITEITERSKLIAFNMSIEAARMGEKGRGVKVITAELHKLNERTFGFSRQVADLLGRFRDYNAILVTNIEEKAGIVVHEVEKGIDASEAAVESLISASSRTDEFTKEIARMSDDINRGLDGVLESLQFQDITRQMIEGAQGILGELRASLDQSLSGQDIRIDQKIKHERFNEVRQRLVAHAKTKDEKTAMMGVQL